MQKEGKVFRLILLSMLSSIAYVLMLLDFPFPGLPHFLKIDFSEVPALLAAVLFGPGAGIIVEAIKNVIHYGVQGSFTGVPVGQAANFIAGSTFVVTASFFIRKYGASRRKGLLLGLSIGTILMTVVMGILNYVIILPAYTWFLNYDQMSPEVMITLILTGITPFNLLKCIFITIIFTLTYLKVQPYMKRFKDESIEVNS